MGPTLTAVVWSTLATVLAAALALFGVLRSGRLSNKTALTAAQVAAGTAERAQLSTDTQAFLQAMERQIAGLDGRLRRTQEDLDRVRLIGEVMASENIRLKDQVAVLSAENAQLRQRVAELERRTP